MEDQHETMSQSTLLLQSGNALIQAIHARASAEAIRLLAFGVSPNTIASTGEPALYLAVANNNLELVQVLLQAGADPNLGDDFSNIYLPPMGFIYPNPIE